MVDNVVLRAAVSVLLLAALLYSLARAAGSPSPHARIDFGLKSLMSGTMLAMLSGAAWPVLPTVVVFAAATWWFAIQATVHPSSRASCAGRAGRATCLYHGTMMAATAFMAASMITAGVLDPAASAVQATGEKLAAAHAQHDEAFSLPVGGWTLDLGALGVVFFAVAVGWWATRLVRSVRSGHGATSGVRHGRLHRADLAAELVGAAAMVVMFAV
ncbi:DUF5134 domain-containing protein [Cryobacterium psychrophilum]|nr:DUF5134 domain-containing protein [Cryobacterium psychrophilum]TDW29617.1 uncharacterized protein DUF5134 [Cryobacterium psychrophilum]